MIKELGKQTLTTMLDNPTATTASFTFLLGFAVISANALMAQPGQHPEPLWFTRDDVKTQSLPASKSVTELSRLQSKRVKTQKISISEPPVPARKPASLVAVKPSPSMVSDLQTELYRLGYYKGEVDGLYGAGTRQAILDFQQSLGAALDGMVTYEILKSAQSVKGGTHPQPAPKVQQAEVKPEVQPSEKRSEHDAEIVRLIQLGLHEYGVKDIAVDGVFGSQTAGAIRKFQERFDLEVDGEPSPQFLRKLRDMGVFQNG